MYFIELIRYLPGRAEAEVLARIKPPIAIPKALGQRQKAFSCSPKWQGRSVFQFSTARALKSSIRGRLVFDLRSGTDQVADVTQSECPAPLARPRSSSAALMSPPRPSHPDHPKRVMDQLGRSL